MTYDKRPIDESRFFRKDSILSVYVPPALEPQPGDMERDLPPGLPPEIHYEGVKANYWLVLREGGMPFRGRTKQFSDDDLEWMRGIREEVEKLLRY